MKQDGEVHGGATTEPQGLRERVAAILTEFLQPWEFGGQEPACSDIVAALVAEGDAARQRLEAENEKLKSGEGFRELHRLWRKEEDECIAALLRAEAAEAALAAVHTQIVATTLDMEANVNVPDD